MKKKISPISGVKITDEDEGRVQSVFATLNVIDSDGDVTRPGAFEDGADVRISAYNHQSWGGALPVGKGTIHEQGDEVILDGQFFMKTDSGRETFEVVKQMDELQEWSYGYDVVKRSDGTFPENDPEGKSVQFLEQLKVHEVSPVIVGAGVGTRTLATKSAEEVNTLFKTLVPEEPGVADYVKLISILNGGQGGTLIPDEYRDEIYQKTSQLLKEADVQAPDLRAGDANGTRLADRIAWLTAELEKVNERVAEVMAKRAEKGKSLGEESYKTFAELESVVGSLRSKFAVGTDEDVQRRRAMARHARASLLATRKEDTP
jgi:hypothetical protein